MVVDLECTLGLESKIGGLEAEPLENFDKMSAFEAFSSNLEAEPLRGSGLEPPEILTKMSAFEAFSSDLEAGP